MNLNEYQKRALVTDVFDQKDSKGNVAAPGFIEKILGLVGESGEFADKIKKLIRDKNGEASPEAREELIKELGDVLWYVASIAQYLESDLETVGQKNLDKLADRHKRSVIQGAGDNR